MTSNINLRIQKQAWFHCDVKLSQTWPFRSPKRARLYKETILSFNLMHVYNSLRVSVVLLFYKTIDISEWKVEYLGKTKSCTNRIGVNVRIRVRVRVKVWVSVKYYVIKVVPESCKIRVFSFKWSHVRGTYPWSFVTQICHSGQPSRGCDRTTFEVMTSVNPPNRFAHKERIW
jgi:hypothetical protein